MHLTERARVVMLTINSHGGESSIAGCVEDMVRDPNPTPFFMTFFSLFFFHVSCFIVI